MIGTSKFFEWYFGGEGSLGGWVFFLIFYIAAAAWFVYDNQRREVKVPGWRLAVILPGLLLLPTIFYRFAGADTQDSLLSYKDLFFYMGLLGGIVPVLAALGYWITFRGITGEQLKPPPAEPPPVLEPAAPPRPMVNAWLIDTGANRSYQLYAGDTRIGRSQGRNDIVIAHPTVSREHVLIREEDGHFTLYDRGAKAGTLLNNRRVRAPEMLAHGDLVVIGDVELKFTTA
jgi:hypothetical protein